SHATQRKAAFVVGIHELPMRRRHIGQEPEPREGVHALVLRAPVGRDARAADPVKTVAADDEITAQLVTRAAMEVSRPPRSRVEAVPGDLPCLPEYRPRFRRPGVREIPLQLVLAVHQHASAGQTFEVDPVTAVGEGDVETIMNESLTQYPCANPGLHEQLDGG